MTNKVFNKSGVYCGDTTTKRNITFDIFNKSKNKNILTFGKMGSGKSIILK